MNSVHNSTRRIVWLVMALAALAALSLRQAVAKDAGVCKKWPESQLAISVNLKARHFVLEPEDQVQQLPPSLEPGARRIFHRTFSLALDVAEPIALFHTSQRRTCVIGRDSEKALPLRIPVFFLGRDGQPAAEVKEDAERTAFARSSSLTDVEGFTQVRFHLRKGGWSFGEIRPFFTCGLPGVMLCEGGCPVDVAPLAQPLIEWVLRGKRWEVEPPPARQEPQPETRTGQSPGQLSPPQKQAARKPEPAPSAPPPSAPASAPAPAGPQPQSCPPVPPCPATATAPAPAPKSEPEPRAIPEAAMPPKPEPPASPPAGPQTLPLRQLAFAFERKGGAPVDSGEVLLAEGKIAILGASASLAAGGIVVTVPEEAAAEAAKLETLQKALPHYRVLAVRAGEGRTLVTVEPLFIHAFDLTIKIGSKGNENVSGCDLAVDVFKNRRLGPGWSVGNVQSLRFRDAGPFYALDLPASVSKNELLIDTAADGGAAHLYSAAAGCRLDGPPFVMAEEMRSGSIVRTLHQTSGQTLVALVSTDSGFSEQVGPPVAEGFWASALDLATSVSEGAWQERVLGRAQFPGSSPETKKLDFQQSGKLAAGTIRDSALKTLIEGSRLGSENPLFGRSKPIARYQLGDALRIIRGDAGLTSHDEAPQESLLLITGGADPADGFFCRRPAPDDPAAPAPAQWVKGVRKMFVIEVWTPAAAKSLAGISRARFAAGAPQGIYSCNFPNSDGGDVALYGVLPEALSDAARAGTFAYLTAQANSHLRP